MALLINSRGNKKISNQGMILSEIILAAAIITIALASVVIVIGGVQATLIDAKNSFESELLARKEISLVHLTNFADLSAGQNTDGFFTTVFSVLPRNDFTTNISADISWFEGAFRKHRILTDQIVDWRHSAGATDCDWLDEAKGSLSLINFGILNADDGNPITDVAALGDYVYVSADSATSSLSDLYVVDVRDPENPIMAGRLNTGPGIAAIAAAGHYIFAANAGSYQMQIIDVANPTHPVLVSQAKLPGSIISGSGGFGNTVHFYDDKIFIGLNKNAGPEFYVVDVSNPQMPIALGSYEISSTVNDVDAQGTRAVVVTPGQTPVLLLDVSNPTTISEITHTTFNGWQTQGAQSVEIHGPAVVVGRTLGGFYSLQPEFVILDRNTLATSTSLKINASVENILGFNDYFYVTTSDVATAFVILQKSLEISTSTSTSYPPIITMTSALSSRGVALTCNSKAMYVVTQNDQDFFHIFSLP